MNSEDATVIALQALAWMAADEDICQAFLAATGASVQEIRQNAADPAFQAAVLAFLTTDDAWVTGFCDSAGLAYDLPLRARYALPGTENIHWT